MTIEKKLNYVAHWDKATAMECWSRYEQLYHEKHGGALHQAIIGSSLDKYIDKECQTFERYARLFAYARGLVERKPLTWSQRDVLQHQLGKPLPPEVIQQDLHHVAQENKLRRLRGGDYFP